MIVPQDLQLLKQAPSQQIPRIFIGNLTAQILDASLQQLVSRFGTISDFERSKCGTFVHISLQADQASVAKCVSSLNHVKWLGASLRVERARQHYIHRLLQEWKHHSCETQLSSQTDTQEQEKSPKPPFHNLPKGKHLRFSFPDEPSHTSTDTPTSLSTAVQRSEPASRPAFVQRSAFATKQSSMLTTLSLFGLSPSSDRNPHSSVKRSPQETSLAEQLFKRPRNTPPQNGERKNTFQVPKGNDTCRTTNIKSEETPRRPERNLNSADGQGSAVGMREPYSIENAKAVEEDPSKIDLQRERNTSLHAFQTLFGHHSSPPDKLDSRTPVCDKDAQGQMFVRYRRAALYTKLQSSCVDARPLQNWRRTRQSESEITNTPPHVFPNDHPQAVRFDTRHRRAALYKKL